MFLVKKSRAFLPGLFENRPALRQLLLRAEIITWAYRETVLTCVVLWYKYIETTQQRNLIETFRASPEPPGLPQQEPPRTIRTRYEGKGPVPAVCLATVTVMAARKEQGCQHGQQRKKIFHGSLTCWRICLSVPVAGLAGTADSGVIPYAIDQQAGREFAIQAVCLA